MNPTTLEKWILNTFGYRVVQGTDDEFVDSEWFQSAHKRWVEDQPQKWWKNFWPNAKYKLGDFQR